jgi:hypothetical protein
MDKEAVKHYGMFLQFFVQGRTNPAFDRVMVTLRHSGQVIEYQDGTFEVTPILKGETGLLAFNQFTRAQQSRFEFIARELMESKPLVPANI